MEKSLVELTGKVRKAIDDIAPGVIPGVVDSFSSDLDAEIAQALEHAATSLSSSLPIELLEPEIITETTTAPSWSRGARTSDGSGYIVLPTDYMRFVSLKMATWKGTVTDLIEPGSEADKMQRSPWSRGTATKPKAMLDTEKISTTVGQVTTTEAKQVLRYWPQGTPTETLVALVYVPEISWEDVTIEENVTETRLKCALKDECEKNLIYTACRIIMEGKKEHAAADKFAQLATI
jgi:hypothetical protein